AARSGGRERRERHHQVSASADRTRRLPRDPERRAGVAFAEYLSDGRLQLGGSRRRATAACRHVAILLTRSCRITPLAALIFGVAIQRRCRQNSDAVRRNIARVPDIEPPERPLR